MSRQGWIAILLLIPTLGCVQLSDRLEDLRLQEGLNQEFRRLNPDLPKGRFARHFERGWKQGLYDTRYGSVTRNSNTTYMASRYEFGLGAEEKNAWATGYEIGSNAYPKPEVNEPIYDHATKDSGHGHTISIRNRNTHCFSN